MTIAGRDDEKGGRTTVRGRLLRDPSSCKREAHEGDKEGKG